MPLRPSARAALACLALAGSAALAPTSPARAWDGRVSWYGAEHGQAARAVACTRRAVGDLAGRFRPDGLTAAHWTLPCGTRLRVSDPATGRSVDVTVTDRGPHPRLRRSVDLARGAAARLGILGRGVIRARITVLPGRATGRLRLAARP